MKSEDKRDFTAYGSSACQLALTNQSGATNTRFYIYSWDAPTASCKFSVDTLGRVASASSFNGTAFNVTSTKDSKKNISPSSIDPLKALDWLKPVEFHYTTESDSCPKHHGLIAECVAGTPASHVVHYNEQGQAQGIDIANLVSLHTSALKELKSAINTKDTRMIDASMSNLANSHQKLASNVSDLGIVISNLQSKINALEFKLENEVSLIRKTLANAKVDLKL